MIIIYAKGRQRLTKGKNLKSHPQKMNFCYKFTFVFQKVRVSEQESSESSIATEQQAHVTGLGFQASLLTKSDVPHTPTGKRQDSDCRTD